MLTKSCSSNEKSGKKSVLKKVIILFHMLGLKPVADPVIFHELGLLLKWRMLQGWPLSHYGWCWAQNAGNPRHPRLQEIALQNRNSPLQSCIFCVRCHFGRQSSHTGFMGDMTAPLHVLFICHCLQKTGDVRSKYHFSVYLPIWMMI